MSEYIKETVTTNEDNQNIKTTSPAEREATPYQTADYIVYFIFGILDVLLAFRFILKLLGANPATGFVSFIYNLSSIFVAPFAGIFNTSSVDGDVVASVFEPATLVAFVVYAVMAWGIVALIKVISGKQQE